MLCFVFSNSSARITPLSSLYFRQKNDIEKDIYGYFILGERERETEWGRCDNALKCILVICLCGRYLLITMLNLYN